LPDEALRRLWEAMAGIYGHLWTSAFGDDANSKTGLLWARGLGGFNPMQVKRGLDACLVAGKPHPPSLPEFRALCLGSDPPPAKVDPVDVARKWHADDELYDRLHVERFNAMARDLGIPEGHLLRYRGSR
jgi:hypothetical protein